MSSDTLTPNLKLTQIDPASFNWAAKLNGDLSIVDAVIGTYFTVSNIRGVWTNSTAYAVDDAVVDIDASIIYKCAVAHTSAQLPTTFAEDRAAHPTYWFVFSTTIHTRGEWAALTGYSLNDVVTHDAVTAICIQAHTSSTDFDADVVAGDWSVIVDGTGLQSQIDALHSLNIPAPTGSDGNKLLSANSIGSAYILNSESQTADLLRISAPTTYDQRFQLALWGDSLTYGYGGEDVLGPYLPYADQLINYLGYRYFNNLGTSGETSTQITTRYLADTAKFPWRAVVWQGRNDIAAFGVGWGTTTLANNDAVLAAALAAGAPTPILLGVTNSGSEDNLSANYAAIVAYNAAATTRYGSKFCDVRAYMCSTQPFTDLGLSPSGTDLTEIASGIIPTTFRRDATNVHFNSTGLKAIAFKVSQLVIAAEAADTDHVQTWRGVKMSSGLNSLASATVSGQHVHAQTSYRLGDNRTGSTGSNRFIYANPRQKIVMIGYNQDIPYGTISAATTREWVFVGDNAGGVVSTGRANTGVGSDVMPVITTASFNSAYGTRAGTGLTTGQSNTLIGVDSGAAFTTQSENTAVGRYTLISSTSANPSTVVGFQIGFALTSGSITGMGWKTLRNVTTGNGDTAVGETAGGSLTTGGNNTYVGKNAGNANVSSNNQTAIGLSAGLLATGTGGVFVGMQAGANVTTGQNVTVIGTNVSAPSATQNNQLNICNYLYGTGMDGTLNTISAGRLGFGVKLPETELEFVGAMTFNPTTEPSTPSSGKCALYVDSGDSNKLKVKFSTGTKTVLGTP